MNITFEIPKYARISWYAQVFVTLDWTFQIHLRSSRPPTVTRTTRIKNTDARPDLEEMEQAINKFPQQLECSDWRSKRKRALRTWPPYCHTCPSLHKGPLAPCLWLRLWRLVFSQYWTKIRPICSSRRSCACTCTLRTTGYYPGISWIIPVYSVISLVNMQVWPFYPNFKLSRDMHLEPWYTRIHI